MRAALLLFCLACAGARPQPEAHLPTRAELDAITERGRQLAEFDNAAARGTDAVFALHPDPALMSRYIAVKTSAGWVVKFGKVEGDVFKVAYEARPGLGAYRAEALVPPREETGYSLAAARAVGLTAGIQRGHRPYNAAVLPGPDGKLFVYAYPAPTPDNDAPLGADIRWLVSADGTKVLEERRMHDGLLAPVPKDRPVAMQMHTHVLRDGIEDTDVMHALQSHIPQRIATSSGAIIEVDPDGHMNVLDAGSVHKR